MTSFDDWKHDKLTAFAKASTEWRIVRDELKNKNYYYNKNSKKSQWIVPSVIDDYEKQLRKEFDIDANVSLGKRIHSPLVETDSVALDANEDHKKQKMTEKSDNLEVSQVVSVVRAISPTNEPVNLSGENLSVNQPVEIAIIETAQDIQAKQLAKENDLKRIESILAQKDAIMEPEVIQHVKALIQLHKQPPAAVVRGLVGTYTGYAQMSRIVFEWIALAEELTDPKARSCVKAIDKSGTTAVATNTAQQSHPVLNVRDEETVVALVAQLIRQRFNRSLVDELVLQFRATPLWLVELMRDDTFRAVLVDLHSANPSSSFLGLCMREMDGATALTN